VTVFFKRFSSAFAWSTVSLLISEQFCYWCSLSRHGTDLAATRCMPKFSVKISSQTVFEILASSATLWTVKQLEWVTFWTFWIFSSFFNWRSSWMFIVLNWSLALFKMFVPLTGLCSTHGFIPRCFFNISKFLKTFSVIWNKISHKHIAHENHPFLIAETFAEQTRHAFIAINTTQRLNKLEWSGLWHLPKETHCYALQSAGPSPSCWCASSKVWKHYRLTSYVISIPWEYVVILHFQNLSTPI